MTRAAILFLMLTGFSSLCAQTLLLKNGQTVTANGLVRKDDLLMVSIKTGSGGAGQVGFSVSDVAELDLPAPDTLSAVALLLAGKKFDQALAKIEPEVAYQKTIRDIPGNWWAKAALLNVSALAGLNRASEAKALADEITANSKDPDILVSAKLQVALATKFDDPQQALAAYDAVINQSKDPSTLSQAWIAEGDVYSAQHEFPDALLAYLTVTTFYPEKNTLIPRALLGSGEAYAKLKDKTNAIRTFQEIVAQYPDSPEAATAQEELIKKENKT